MPIKGHVVVVDSYPPTNMGRGRLAHAFREAGYGCVRVQSSPEVPIVFQSPAGLGGYVANIVHRGDLAGTLRDVAAYQPVAVVAGSEVGVEFADLLSEQLDLPTSNGTRLSAARRDKFQMAEILRAAGVRAAPQLLISEPDELAAWHGEIGGRIVVKPIRSGGGVGVHFCDSPDESVRAYRALLGASNAYTADNEAILAQQYLFGTEYMVNVVSRDGNHHVTDIWRTSRVSANGVLDLCDAISLVPGDDDLACGLAAYAGDVLDALAIRYGPAHLEIKMTPDGPCLVEVGARIVGGDISHNAYLATGSSQVEWTVDAYVRPDRFLATCEGVYQAGCAFASVALISPFEGTLVGYRDLDAIKQLESLHEIRVLVHPGEQIMRTVDDLTYPVLVNLRHDVPEVVQRDLNTIRYLDGRGFYDVVA